jgi:hypothetical protein
MKRLLSIIALLLNVLTLSACTTMPVMKPNPANPIRTIAVLPLVNNTNDVDGPFVVRTLLAARLGGYFYSVKPLEETDSILRDQMGVTLGSQLDMATTTQLCEKLRTDGIVHGSLEDFSQKITGAYNNKRVRLRIMLDNCKTGATAWKNGVGVKREVRASDSLLKNVPVLGNAITAAGAASSVLSSMSDKGGADLPKFRNEEIQAPWEDISEANSSAELNLVFGLGEKIAKKARNSPLLAEAEVAIEILLHGDYDDGSDIIPYGTMIPPGPVMPMVPAATDTAK